MESTMDTQTLINELNTFKRIVGLNDLRVERLSVVGELMRPHIESITDRFYDYLLAEETTANFLAGRVDHLKSVHRLWIGDLLSGVYDDAFFMRQIQIGRAHVTHKVPPLFLTSSFSILRILLFDKIETVVQEESSVECPRCTRALGRLLDACQFLIDRSYEQDRLARISAATGMSLPLIEALVMLKQ